PAKSYLRHAPCQPGLPQRMGSRRGPGSQRGWQPDLVVELPGRRAPMDQTPWRAAFGDHRATRGRIGRDVFDLPVISQYRSGDYSLLANSPFASSAIIDFRRRNIW